MVQLVRKLRFAIESCKIRLVDRSVGLHRSFLRSFLCSSCDYFPLRQTMLCLIAILWIFSFEKKFNYASKNIHRSFVNLSCVEYSLELFKFFRCPSGDYFSQNVSELRHQVSVPSFCSICRVAVNFSVCMKM